MDIRTNEPLERKRSTGFGATSGSEEGGRYMREEGSRNHGKKRDERYISGLDSVYENIL